MSPERTVLPALTQPSRSPARWRLLGAEIGRRLRRIDLDVDLHLQELREEALQTLPEHPQQRGEQLSAGMAANTALMKNIISRTNGTSMSVTVVGGGPACRRRLRAPWRARTRRPLGSLSRRLPLALAGLPLRVALASDGARQVVVRRHGEGWFRHAPLLRNNRANCRITT